MQRLQIQLAEQQVEELRRIAGQRRWSVAAVGGFHSGLGDLAEHHDRYLAEDAEA
ncbi:MAG: hypothetical protein ACRDZO_20425 [Egibacteraceae bacterium]